MKSVEKSHKKKSSNNGNRVKDPGKQNNQGQAPRSHLQQKNQHSEFLEK